MSESLKNFITGLLEEYEKTLEELGITHEDVECFEAASPNSAATYLLSAIESHLPSLDKEMREALSKLSTFLHGDELRDRITTSAAEALSRVFDSCPLETFKDLPNGELLKTSRAGDAGLLQININKVSRPRGVPWDKLRGTLARQCSFVETKLLEESIEKSESLSTKNDARNLLAAIESKQLQDPNNKKNDAFSTLSTCLQSDDLKERIGTSAAKAVSGVINNCLLEALPGLSLGETTKSFKILSDKPNNVNKSSPLLLNSINKVSRPLEKVYDNHVQRLETSTLHLQGTKIKKSREMHLVLKPLSNLLCEDEDKPYTDALNVPPSPPQPTHPDVSLIDHLMQSALIKKHIEEGNFNKSFGEVLSSCNLSLVMVACRTADPAKVFSPCSLSQPVLLSLVQQLATDMVHETQLKCRYLEEALINLDISDQVTQSHLELVVGEVRSHLSKFVRTYPNHVASRRIALIIMAADNLMK